MSFMRGYGKYRFLVLAIVLAGAFFVAQSGFAQAPPASEAAAAEETPKVGTLDSFGILLRHPDFVSVTILLLSIAGVSLIIQGFIRARSSVMLPEESIARMREMINNRQFRELLEFTETDPSFVGKTLNPALKRAPNFAAMKEAMETAVGEQTAQEFRRIEYLNIIGNLGPLLGLLGTVIGMIVAFEEMNQAGGRATPAQLAGGISKALAHTMAGLMLALPCLACFGILRTLIDRLTVRGALVAEELLLMIKPAEAKAPAIARPANPAAQGSMSGTRVMPVPAPAPVQAPPASA